MGGVHFHVDPGQGPSVLAHDLQFSVVLQHSDFHLVLVEGFEFLDVVAIDLYDQVRVHISQFVWERDRLCAELAELGLIFEICHHLLSDTQVRGDIAEGLSVALKER